MSCENSYRRMNNIYINAAVELLTSPLLLHTNNTSNNNNGLFYFEICINARLNDDGQEDLRVRRGEVLRLLYLYSVSNCVSE